MVYTERQTKFARAIVILYVPCFRIAMYTYHSKTGLAIGKSCRLCHHSVSRIRTWSQPASSRVCAQTSSKGELLLTETKSKFAEDCVCFTKYGPGETGSKKTIDTIYNKNVCTTISLFCKFFDLLLQILEYFRLLFYWYCFATLCYSSGKTIYLA